MGACASRPADAEVEALEGQLAAARAAVRHAERQAAGGWQVGSIVKLLRMGTARGAT